MEKIKIKNKLFIKKILYKMQLLLIVNYNLYILVNKTRIKTFIYIVKFYVSIK